MASGTIPCLVKKGTVSGNTDANSNVRLSTSTQKVVAIRLDDAGGSHVMGIPFVFWNGQTYMKVLLTNNMATLSSGTAVTGDYWYMD